MQVFAGIHLDDIAVMFRGRRATRVMRLPNLSRGGVASAFRVSHEPLQ